MDIVPMGGRQFGQAPHSPSSRTQTNRTAPSSQHKRIIADLAVRFPPAANTDPAETARRLALLITDVADIPADRLEIAAQRWARDRQFMPKASELRAYVEMAAKSDPAGVDRLHAYAAHLNSQAFVSGNGWRYRVGKTADGIACLERDDCAA